MFFNDDNQEDQPNESQSPDPVVDANDIGEEGTRIGEGHDPVEDDVL